MNLTSTILSLRDQRVILDADLARIYGVQTRVLNQAVKRNLDKFPEDFMFQLGREEILRISQTVTSLRKLKFSKRLLSPNMAHSWPPQCSTARWPSK